MSVIKALIRKLFKLIMFLLLTVLLLAGTALFFLVEDLPVVNKPVALTSNDIKEIQNLINETRADLAKGDGEKKLILSQVTVNNLGAYMLGRVRQDARVVTIFEDGRIYTSATYIIPPDHLLTMLGKYINMSLQVRAEGVEEFVPEKIRIGKVQLPATVINMIWPDLKRRIGYFTREYADIYKAIRQVKVSHQQIVISYSFKQRELEKTVARIKTDSNTYLLGDEVKRRIRVYGEELEKLILELHEKYGRTQVPLTELLLPMTALAKERGELFGKPVEENRIMLVSLGAYMTGKNIRSLITDERVKQLPILKLVLQKRIDLSRHFIVSAALVAIGDSEWASVAGLAKEERDAAGQSGFSFSDMMADKAGVIMAEKMLVNRAGAVEMQNRLLMLKHVDELLGPTAGLPDGISAAQFERQYGGDHKYKYELMVREIDRRIGQLKFYH